MKEILLVMDMLTLPQKEIIITQDTTANETNSVGHSFTFGHDLY